MSTDTLALARQIIRTVPLVMRVVNIELRKSAPLQDFSQVGLLRIVGHKGPITVSKLADMWSVSAPTMSRSIRRFEERGWVTLTRTPEDRRQVLVELTEEGQNVLVESFEAMARSVGELLETMSKEDQDTLAQGMDMLIRAFFEAAQISSVEFGDARTLIDRFKLPEQPRAKL